MHPTQTALSWIVSIATKVEVVATCGGDQADPAARALAIALEANGERAAVARVRDAIAGSMLGAQAELAGPVGERNLYALHPRCRVLALPQTRDGLLEQLGVALATGNDVVTG